MAVKAVELVRKIRDRNYEETRKLPTTKQIQFIRKKAELLKKEFSKGQQMAAKGKTPAAKAHRAS